VFSDFDMQQIFPLVSASRPTPGPDRATMKKRGASEANMIGDRSGIYAPEELLLFRRVFENAVGALPAVMRTPDARSRIARNILDCAATGERDPVELRIAALGRLQASAA
jgi:hypothetical protein